MKGVGTFFSDELLKRGQAWRDLRERLVPALPPEYLAHISYAVADDKTITIFTDSAAWTAKIRFYDSEILKVMAQHGRKLRFVQVKTAPGTGAKPDR
jgi:hypothetical protein